MLFSIESYYGNLTRVSALKNKRNQAKKIPLGLYIRILVIESNDWCLGVAKKEN